VCQLPPHRRDQADRQRERDHEVDSPTGVEPRHLLTLLEGGRYQMATKEQGWETRARDKIRQRSYLVRGR